MAGSYRTSPFDGVSKMVSFRGYPVEGVTSKILAGGGPLEAAFLRGSH